MKPDLVFKIVNLITLIPWGLMILLPRWNFTDSIIRSYFFPCILAVVYIIYLLSSLGKASGGFSTLEGVGKLFRNKNALLAGWVHYLVFDLFVGTWQWSDSYLIGMSHFLLVPCLVLTLLFGPAGFLVYYLIRSFIIGNSF